MSSSRSIKAAVRRLGSAAAVLLIGVSGLALAGASEASARTQAPASPAGSYTATLFAPHEQSAQDALTLTAKGHFSFKAGPQGKWTETGTAITMTGIFKKVTFVFTITQEGMKLGSKAHPGKFTADGSPDAKWFAVPN